MKIKIAFCEEETEKARRVLRAVEQLLPGSTVRSSDAHAPFLHLYVQSNAVAYHKMSTVEKNGF